MCDIEYSIMTVQLSTWTVYGMSIITPRQRQPYNLTSSNSPGSCTSYSTSTLGDSSLSPCRTLYHPVRYSACALCNASPPHPICRLWSGVYPLSLPSTTDLSMFARTRALAAASRCLRQSSVVPTLPLRTFAIGVAKMPRQNGNTNQHSSTTPLLAPPHALTAACSLRAPLLSRSS